MKKPPAITTGGRFPTELHQLALNLSTALSTNTPDPLVPASSCTPAVAHATAHVARHPAGARSDPAPPHQAPPANPASDHTQTSTHHHLAPLHHAADPSSHQRATRSPAASRWPCQRAAHPIALQPPVDQLPTAHQRLQQSTPLPMPPWSAAAVVQCPSAANSSTVWRCPLRSTHLNASLGSSTSSCWMV